jgi:signal peptidase II
MTAATLSSYRPHVRPTAGRGMELEVTGNTPVERIDARARARPPRWLTMSLIALAVLAVDQGTKAIVRAALAPGEGVEAVGPYSIFHVHNPGVAGGGFAGNALPLAVLSTLGVMLLYEFLSLRGGSRVWLALGFGLLVGGGLGNIVDRARLGWVTDFIRNGDHAFNVADLAIFIGGLVVLVGLIAGRLRPSQPTSKGA